MILSNSFKTLVKSVVTLLLLLLIILWMAGAFEEKIGPGINASSTQYSGPTLTLIPESMLLFEDVTATVQSEQTTEVAAQIQARIKAIHIKSGDRVTVGQVLITLDDQNLKARRAQADGNLSAIGARLQRAQSHFNRTQNLYAKDSATLVDLEMAKADYESFKAQLTSAQQVLNAAQHRVDYSQIKATFAGRVIDRYAEPGDIALPGKKLLSIYDPKALRFEAHVRESVAVGLKLGQVLEARIDALDITLPVTISEIGPAADHGARSLLVKTRAEQQPGLFPGMFARLRIPQGEDQVLLIPQNYLHQVGQLDVVWVVQDGQIVRRFVRLGQSYPNGHIKIIAGLTAGEQIIPPKQALSVD